MRQLHRLSAAAVKHAPAGKHPDGGGLWLIKRGDGGGQWMLRVSVHGRRREMGLGSIRDVSLKDARLHAETARRLVREGKDPIKERQRERRERERGGHLLKDIAYATFEARKAELKNDGKSGRWFTPLELHVLPRLGDVPITEIDQRDIANTLRPIWHAKAETARKSMNRLNLCLKHAAAMGLDVDIQACAKAKLLLGRSRHQTRNIPALPWSEAPDFYKSLGDSSTELALRLTILTACRSGEVRFIHVNEVDGDLWTIPSVRTKTGIEHRVPLSREAQRVLSLAEAHERRGFFFANPRKGVISDMTMSNYMKRKGMEARPHGFRSTFRTWCAEATDISEEIAETALGHKVGSEVTRAYRRTDYLDQRRDLMERWAAFLTG
ncbi:MAG: integrase arm-type DNA-binding domain-containing protein [Alphaproteobacteria bacterium]|nr:integrase arm-type DNA-binding domain-containing protein [Alphaproteobacteria bacterium]